MTTTHPVPDAALKDVSVSNVAEESPVDTTPKTTVVRGPGSSALEAILNYASLGQDEEADWKHPRFGTNFHIRSITQEEFERLNKKHTKNVRIGNTANITQQIDGMGFNIEICVTALLDPNFRDEVAKSKLAARVGLPPESPATSIFTKIMLAGEIGSLAKSIMELSGFQDDEETIGQLKD